MQQIRRLVGRAVRILRTDGPVAFVRDATEYLKRLNVGGDGPTVSYQHGTRVDFERRWELLCDRVERTDGTLLDIGCAEGHLTARFADLGLMAIGIERRAHTVATARRGNADRSNLGFLQYEVTPETVRSLPSVDIVLLLTVYHHWVSEYGREAAEEMLRTLGERCTTLVVEVPDRQIEGAPEEEADLGAYYRAYFERVYDGAVTVDHLGTTAYKGGDRSDLLFALDLGPENSDR